MNKIKILVTIIGTAIIMVGVIYGVYNYDDYKTTKLTGTITDKQITADGNYITLDNQTVRSVMGREYVTLNIGDTYTYQLESATYFIFIVCMSISIGIIILAFSPLFFYKPKCISREMTKK